MDGSFKRHKIITQISVLEASQMKAADHGDYKIVNEIAQTIGSLLQLYEYTEQLTGLPERQ